jgi:hypothetical protein
MKGVVSNDGAFFIGRSEGNSRKKGARAQKEDWPLQLTGVRFVS